MQIHSLNILPLEEQLCFDNTCLERVSSLLLIGIVIQVDRKWNSQVQLMVSHAACRLYKLSIPKKSGASVSGLVTIYKMYSHPQLEF